MAFQVDEQLCQSFTSIEFSTELMSIPCILKLCDEKDHGTDIKCPFTVVHHQKNSLDLKLIVHSLLFKHPVIVLVYFERCSYLYPLISARPMISPPLYKTYPAIRAAKNVANSPTVISPGLERSCLK